MVIKDGAAYRGANWSGAGRSYGMAKPTLEERKAKAAQHPRVNKVVWL